MLGSRIELDKRRVRLVAACEIPTPMTLLALTQSPWTVRVRRFIVLILFRTVP